MSTETELRHTVTLTESDRRLIAELLSNEWWACNVVRRPYNAASDGEQMLRLNRVESIQRKLGYL